MAALAKWASSLAADEIPEDVYRRAALVMADDIACAMGSRNEPEVNNICALSPPGVPEARVYLGGEHSTDRATAAMLNAIASNWCQLDEGHRQVMCHAGLYVVPAAIAEAEASGATVRQLLRATVIGYEVTCRFAKTWSFANPTVHPHAAWSAVGSAAAVAALRQLDARRYLDAVSASATLAIAGPFDHAVRGALIQNTWAGLGIWLGFRCVDWATCGIGGLATSAHDVFARNLGAKENAGQLSQALGREWAIRGGYHKLHACAQQSHAAVEAALRLRRRWPAGCGPANITRITLECHRLALSMDNRAPTTALAARFSVPHIVATVLTLGRADAEAFSTENLNTPDIARLRAMMELGLIQPELPSPNDRAARLRVHLDNGDVLTEECLSAPGGPDQPFSDDVILKKCDDLAGGAYPGFCPLVERIYALDPALLLQPWKDVAKGFLEPDRKDQIRIARASR
jgi:2-methylcitrate dehydratase PrpD